MHLNWLVYYHRHSFYAFSKCFRSFQMLYIHLLLLIIKPFRWMFGINFLACSYALTDFPCMDHWKRTVQRNHEKSKMTMTAMSTIPTCTRLTTSVKYCIGTLNMLMFWHVCMSLPSWFCFVRINNSALYSMTTCLELRLPDVNDDSVVTSSPLELRKSSKASWSVLVSVTWSREQTSAPAGSAKVNVHSNYAIC